MAATGHRVPATGRARLRANANRLREPAAVGWGTAAEPTLRTLFILLSLPALLGPPAAWAAPPGDAARGRALLLQRQESGCILCHVLPGLPPGGALGPPLNDLSARYSAQALLERIADARRVNPQTIMPPYLSTEGLHNVARAQVGRTVLTEQSLADIVAYLLAPVGANVGANDGKP